MDGFIYPEHICKIAIFGFLSIKHHVDRYCDILNIESKGSKLRGVIF